jgi:hypothetical protein
VGAPILDEAKLCSLAITMLKSILAPFSGHDALPISAKILFSITAVFVLVAIWIHDIFKPPHKRRNLNGKPWKMPPGPTGVPFFGSIYDVKKGPKTVRTQCSMMALDADKAKGDRTTPVW